MTEKTKKNIIITAFIILTIISVGAIFYIAEMMSDPLYNIRPLID